MEMVMSNGFAELSANEMMDVDGGGKGGTVFAAFGGCILVANAPVGALLGGPGLGLTMAVTGCACLDYACEHM